MSKSIITMGLPGSGKSYITDKHYPDMIKVDCDLFKQLRQDYDPEKPEFVHDWSKRCVEYMLQICIESGDSFIYDSTGTDIVCIEALISKLLKAGYDIELLYVSVNLDTAIDRNNTRTRKVPEHIIYTKQTQLQQAFMHISPKVHTVKIVNND